MKGVLALSNFPHLLLPNCRALLFLEHTQFPPLARGWHPPPAAVCAARSLRLAGFTLNICLEDYLPG